MAIVQNQPNIDDSPWYDIMENKANAWNNFALDNNLPIEGFYNASIVTFEIDEHNLKLFGIRQNSNVGTIMIGMNHISEELSITCAKQINSKSSYIRVRKNKIWNRLRRRLKYKTIYNNYFITYNEEFVFEDLKRIKLFDFDSLKRFTINKKGVKLVLHELPAETEIINSFLNFCKTLK